MKRHILVPLDGSASSEEILPEVQRIATLRDEVHFLNVVPSLPTPVGMDPTHRLALEDQASAYLEALRERWAPGQPGLDFVRSGEPAQGILNLALEKNIDLIAMCTHSRGGLLRLLLGSVASEVVRHSQLPVLLARPGLPRSARPLQKLLVSVEGNEAPKELLETVKGLVLGPGAEIILFHAIAPVTDPAPQWAPPFPQISEVAQERSLQAMADALEGEGYSAWPVVSVGEPVEAILAQVKSLGPDLIALATHGRSGLGRLLEGSVAEGVLRKAPIAVLLQKPLVIPHPVRLGERHA